MDPNQWIRDARAANDDDAVAWLTRMRTTNTTQGEQTQKRRRLNVDAQRWEQYKMTTDTLAQEHAQRSHDIYHNAHAAEVTSVAPARTARMLLRHTNRQNTLPHACD